MDIATGRVSLSRHVVFDESRFPFADASRPTAFPSPTVPTQVSLPAAPSLWVPPLPSSSSNHPMITRTRDGTRRPKTFFASTCPVGIASSCGYLFAA